MRAGGGGLEFFRELIFEPLLKLLLVFNANDAEYSSGRIGQLLF